MSQAGRERSGRWVAVLLASLAAHLLALSALRLDSRTDTVWDSNTVDIHFTVAERAPPAEPPEPSSAEPPSQQNPVQVPTVASRRSRPSVVPSRAAPPEPAATTPAPSESELLLALDPATAARSFMVSQRAAPSDASNAEGQASQSSDAGPRNYFEGVGRKQYLTVRDPPKLRRHRDGTHHFQGHTFKAVVEPDGSVTFDDGYGQGVTLRFDITDAIMRRRGEDPYRVEKNWFLEGTQEFRHELYERWQAKQTLVAIRKLRARLLRISENETLSGSEKEARVIALFQDTADDEAGALARNAISEFVADRMPGVELSR
ncbi:MAG: hypothetical protein KJO40_11545 [Deltaproteobacteria bacterium]|nr:hypothetical protein [Deltaproteobacteria bacterium]